MPKMPLRFGALGFLVLVGSGLLLGSLQLPPNRWPRTPRRTSGALRALNEWTAARAWPEADIPRTGYYEAHQYSRSLLVSKPGPSGAAASLADRWRSIGPLNIGGRTLDIAFNPLNPSTVYAGSASGGLWRTLNGGVGPRAWSYVPTGFPVSAVSSIAIPPADSLTIYIGTGEVYNYRKAIGGAVVRTTRGSYGIGILKSTDGGSTWNLSLDWSAHQDRGVWAVRIDPSNSSRVWAATTEGVYRSTNAGASWTPVLNVIMATDIEVDPTNGNQVFAACGNFASPGFGIYRTTDGGANWTRLSSGLPSYGGMARLSISPSSPNVIYAGIGNGSADGAGTWLCRSSNSGTSWSTVSTTDYSTYQGWYSHDVAVHPTNPDHVIAVGIDIWRSLTGGSNPVKLSVWENAYGGVVPEGGPEGDAVYSHADHHSITFNPANPQVVYFGTDGGVFRTTDGGVTFQGVNGGYQSTQFYNGFSNATGDTVPAMGGMQDNFTAIYQGTGAWNRVIGGDGCWTAIDPANPLVMYGSYQFLNILRSTDGGANFAPVTPPNAGTTSFVAPYVLSPVNPMAVFAGRSAVYRSFDRGSTWTAGASLNGNPVISLASANNLSQYILFAGTVPNGLGRSIYRSSNGGSTWTDVTATLPNRYPMDIAVDPTNSSRAFVVFGGFGTSHVFMTENSGGLWQDIGASLPDLPTSAVFVDPVHPDHIYVGNDLGVFVTFNEGGLWGAMNEGLPDAAVVADISLAAGPRRLRVATHGNGVFERSIPETATGVPEDPLAVSRITTFTMSPNPFRSSTRIAFSLEAAADVELAIYDVAGRLERRLVTASRREAGNHVISWDGTGDTGRPVASGRYFARLRAGGEVRSLTLLRVR